MRRDDRGDASAGPRGRGGRHACTTRRRVLRAVLGGTSVAVLSAPTQGAGRLTGDVRLGGRVDGWVGLEPDAVAAETNPTLRLVEGRRYAVAWENLDGAPHELVVETATGDVAARTERRSGRGTTASVSFTATSALERYVCAVHPATMRGRIVVGSEGPAGSGLVARTTGPPPADDAAERPATGSAAFSFDADGTMDWRLELRNLEGVTQVTVREAAAGVLGPVLVPLLLFAASPDGLAGGDPRDVPPEASTVWTGVVEDRDAVAALANRPADYVLVVHTVDYPAGQLRSALTPVDVLELFTVRVENVAAPTAFDVPGVGAVPVILSPGAYAVTDAGDGNPLFVPGRLDRGRGLDALAEDGDPSRLARSVAGSASGTFSVPVGESAAGGIGRGEAFAFTVAGRPGERLFLALKLAETNDLFYGTANGIALFAGRERAFEGDATAAVALWDAGTERDELPGTSATQPPRQTAPNAGQRERVPVRLADDGYLPAAADALRVLVRPAVDPTVDALVRRADASPPSDRE